MKHYPVVVERESNGTYSAWVAGLPGVYAAANSAVVAKNAIRRALVAHLELLESQGVAAEPLADVAIIRYDGSRALKRDRATYVGLGALMGRRTSAAKVAAARDNGRKGGRPKAARKAS